MRKWLSCWMVAMVVLWGVNLFDASAVSAQQPAEHVLKKTIALAKKGYAINTEQERIKLGSTAAEVKKKFGPPDYEDSPTHLVYSQKRLQFFFEETVGIPDSKRRVISIGTTDQRYENITYEQVQKALADYEQISEVKGEDAVYVTYRVGPNFLVFDFYYDFEGKNPDTIKEVHIQKQPSS